MIISGSKQRHRILLAVQLGLRSSSRLEQHDCVTADERSLHSLPHAYNMRFTLFEIGRCMHTNLNGITSESEAFAIAEK